MSRPRLFFRDVPRTAVQFYDWALCICHLQKRDGPIDFILILMTNRFWEVGAWDDVATRQP
jgi:hypothetical protein